MAVYKVPQDVEADDKLLGPFSFRQFVYLLIVAMAIGIAWGLSQLFIPLAIIPLPVIIFFGALALPLRKDQPMEIYMAAMVSFYLKPRRRLWDPDGIDSFIEITAPKIVEYLRTKELSTSEAERRFTYLAEIVDSKGWAVRGADVTAPNSAMNSSVYFEAQQTQDILDNENLQAKSIDDMLAKSDTRRRENAVSSMQNAFSSAIQAEIEKPMPSPSSYFGGVPLTEIDEPVDSVPSQTSQTTEKIEFNPYPEIRQSIIEPLGQKKPVPEPEPPTTSEKVVSPDIINLASNTDLSIATIASEANRIQEKQNMVEEVIINLR
jgi:hypothetical protein